MPDLKQVSNSTLKLEVLRALAQLPKGELGVLGGQVLDAGQARAIIEVHDRLSEKRQAILLTLNVPGMIMAALGCLVLSKEGP